MDMMKNLVASRECHHMCEEAMDGLNDDAVKKIVRPSSPCAVHQKL